MREVFRLDDFWAAVEALDNELPTHVQTMLYLEARRLLDRSSRWLVQARRASIDVAAEVEHFQAALDELVPLVPELLVGLRARAAALRAAEFAGLGVPEQLAERAAALLDTFSLLDVVEIATAEKLPAARGGRCLLRRLGAHRGRPDADPHHRAAPRRPVERAGPVGAAVRPLRRAGRAHPAVLTSTSSTDSPGERIAAWEEQNAEGVARAQATLEEIVALDSFDLATLSVALRTIRTLLRG